MSNFISTCTEATQFANSCLYIIFTVPEVDSQFYLALNGTDSPSCGQNISTACRTFPWLLDVFYNQTYRNNVHLPTLNLIVATSFEIGPDILVRNHFQLSQSKHVYKRWVDIACRDGKTYLLQFNLEDSSKG